MTYDQIRKLLFDNKLDTLARDLESAVEDEAAVLASTHDNNRKVSHEWASTFYAEEITECLRLRPGDRVITPQDILGHRRTPTVKAIAFLMIEAGIKVPS